MSDFFRLFDVDGDGLISYFEYLLIVTFLSIPPQASSSPPFVSFCSVFMRATDSIAGYLRQASYTMDSNIALWCVASGLQEARS